MYGTERRRKLVAEKSCSTLEWIEDGVWNEQRRRKRIEAWRGGRDQVVRSLMARVQLVRLNRERSKQTER